LRSSASSFFQLQKNCLLTLCSDRILHESRFDFHLLATLVMNDLQIYTDLAIIQPGVAILSLLTTRVSKEKQNFQSTLREMCFYPA
jgi:Zyg-11 family protein